MKKIKACDPAPENPEKKLVKWMKKQKDLK
jgi:hypothetical protein